MHIRALLISLLLACFAAPSAEAKTIIKDPQAFVATLLAKAKAATSAKPYVPPDDIYTARLSALMALDKKEAGEDVGRLDFDIWTGAQDWELSDMKVRSVDVENAKDRKIVIANFKNSGKPYELHYYFERGPGGWKLDDVRALGGKDEQWTLSVVLKYGWADTSTP